MRLQVISNSTPIIALAGINELNLLTLLFETVFITIEVYQEATDFPNRKGAVELQSLISTSH